MTTEITRCSTPGSPLLGWYHGSAQAAQPDQRPHHSEGRPSVSPEQLLLLASLLQAFYGIRSERLLLVQLNDNLLFRWFVGLSPDDPIWHPTTCTKKRERLLNEQVMGR